MNDIINKIKDELERAKRIHPDFPSGYVRMTAIMGEEAGEAVREANRLADHEDGASVDALKTELIQTAAMCVRCLEALEEQGSDLPEWVKEDALGYNKRRGEYFRVDKVGSLIKVTSLQGSSCSMSRRYFRICCEEARAIAPAYSSMGTLYHRNSKGEWVR